MRVNVSGFFCLILLVLATITTSCRPDPKVVPPEATYKIGGTVSGMDGTLVLLKNGVDELELTANGGFVFAQEQKQGTSYAVTIKTRPLLQNCMVAHSTGTVAGDVSDISVTCADKAWGAAEQLGETDRDGVPAVAVAAGRVIAVWPASDGAKKRIFARVYAGSSWSAAQAVSQAAAAGDASSPDIATAGGGEALLVYLQSDGSKNRLYALSFANGAWSAAQLLSDATKDCATPRVSGNAGIYQVVWVQEDGSRDAVFTSRLSSGSWSGRVRISPQSGGNAIEPQIAIAANGDVTAVWEQYSGSHFRVYSNRYHDGVWSAAETTISADNGEQAWRGKVAAADGGALAVWYQNDSSGKSRVNSAYFNGSWSAATSFDSPSGGDARFPDVADAGDGSYQAAWTQKDGNGNLRIYRSRFDGSWSTPELFTSGVNEDEHSQALSILAAERYGWAAWGRSGGVYGSLFREGVWRGPYALGDGLVTGPVVTVDIDEDADGNAALVWKQQTSTAPVHYIIMARVYR